MIYYTQTYEKIIIQSSVPEFCTYNMCYHYLQNNWDFPFAIFHTPYMGTLQKWCTCTNWFITALQNTNLAIAIAEWKLKLVVLCYKSIQGFDLCTNIPNVAISYLLPPQCCIWIQCFLMLQQKLGWKKIKQSTSKVNSWTSITSATRA